MKKLIFNFMLIPIFVTIPLAQTTLVLLTTHVSLTTLILLTTLIVPPRATKLMSALGKLALILFVALPINSFAVGKENIPSGSESYLDRPDILKIEAQELKSDKNDPNWAALKAAHFSFVAELLSIYSTDTQIYFLARDAEYLYDVARLVTENTVDSSRIHLLNVSRANMRDKNIKAYLEENGISEAKLISGQKVLFVDTGFSGTIPRVLAANFSAAANQNLKTHLIVSSNEEHPSSRVFLAHLNPSINEQVPANMQSSIITYEHMYRFTDRSSQIVFSDGHYHPISNINGKTDGQVSKPVSLAMMQDLKAEWQKPETKKRYQKEKIQIKSTLKLLTAQDSSAREKAVNYLKESLEKSKNTANGRQLEAQVRDIMEAQINTIQNIEISLSDLGLINVNNSQTANIQASKKNELIKKYPEWAPVLENPDDMIPKLFSEQNWQMIGNIIDANVDFEINAILTKSLYDGSAKGIKAELQRLFIEKGDTTVLKYLARYTFAEPHTRDMKELIKLVIEKGNFEVLEFLAKYTFSKPHTHAMKDLIKLLIEKGDVDVLYSLAVHTFSKPHTKDMKDLIKLVIEKGDADVLYSLAVETFSQPHTQDMKELIKLVIEKGNLKILATLARFTFPRPHTHAMKDLIKLLIEKGDAKILKHLAEVTFSQPHMNTSIDQVMKSALDISDPVQRKKVLDEGFAKYYPISPALHLYSIQCQNIQL